MPYVDFDDPSIWQAMYNPPFIRENFLPHGPRGNIDGNNLLDALISKGLEASHRVVIVGGGFGWNAETFIARGYDNIVVCDSSSYIQERLAGNAVLPILNENLLTEESRLRVLNALGGTCDLAITEDVVAGLYDNEIASFAPMMRAFATRIAHWVTPYLGADRHTMEFNWKPIDEWKAILSPDIIVKRGAGEAI